MALKQILFLVSCVVNDAGVSGYVKQSLEVGRRYSIGDQWQADGLTSLFPSVRL